jgi:hypothetical protein
MKQSQITNELSLLELGSSVAAVAGALLIIPPSRHRTVATRISGGNIVRQVSFSLPSLSAPSQPDGSSK